MRERIATYADVEAPRNLGLISLSHGVNEFYSVAFPPIIPLLVADFGISYGEAGLLLSVFFAMYSIFQLPAGLLADRVGKRRLLVVGLVGMAGGILLAATATGFGMLVAAQVVVGICGSTYHPAGMSLISDFETQSTEGKAMGVFGFGGMTGIASAPVIVGGLASLFDWRVALTAAAAVGLVGTIVVAILFRDSTVNDESDDLAKRNDGGEEAVDGGTSSVDDDAGLVRRAYAAAEDVLQFQFTWTVLLLIAVTVLVSLQIRAILTFTTAYLFDAAGQSTSRANAAFFAMLVASSISSLWIGNLADRFNRGFIGIVAAVSTVLLLVGTAALVSFGPATLDGLAFTAVLFALFFLIGFAVYGCTPVKNALISEYAETEYSGSLFGVTQTTSAIGSTVGPALIGFVADDYGIDVAFPLIAGIGIAVAVVFLGLSRTTATA